MRCRVCGAPMRDGEGAFMVPIKERAKKILRGGS